MNEAISESIMKALINYKDWDFEPGEISRNMADIMEKKLADQQYPAIIVMTGGDDTELEDLDDDTEMTMLDVNIFIYNDIKDFEKIKNSLLKHIRLALYNDKTRGGIVYRTQKSRTLEPVYMETIKKFETVVRYKIQYDQ